jgi:tRNA-splicing ligase RtcB
MLKINTNKPYKIYAEVLEQEALNQFEVAMQLDCVVQGALMPDAHTGYTLPIGAVVACKDMVFPAMVGYDIGCGMCAVPTTFSIEDIRANAKAIFDQIYLDIPTGFSHNQKDTEWVVWESIPHSEALDTIFSKNGLKQLGSLGSGNHFIEVGVDEENVVWFVIHSGSRGIGHAVASHYMRLASGDGKARDGFFGFDTNSLNGFEYICDLNFCLEFALTNRFEMLKRVEKAVQRTCTGVALFEDTINRNHNHVELKDGLWIHRKGATHAEEGMMGVIPGNMRDGSFIVRGKGNPDSLFSSSHGAGRVLGRKEAQRVLTMEDFSATMQSVVAKVNTDTLDESPFAYKNIFDVMKQQGSLVDIVAHVKPIINIKG